ncbi:phosphoglycerate mutase family protein [Neobacillus sp. OS1-32]|uniref:histidine phosphatase family protein n=1 Tax=Neobacillus sp. OS1-32 TaxID=3070682 RepID=UPI0027E0D092|nr:phosphoglycerate mutase family protein [Neobacillus sp. OS1-32]WML31656.1 phosphoglycerate mutase family protein [Neobacillus sp. OS1-32]
MRITLIRHLPTEWNRKQRLQGSRDIPISDVSDTDQRRIAFNQQILQSLSPFDIVLASTLRRTQQTARLYGYHPETEHLLDELNFGRFEGQSKEKLFEDFGNEWLENPKVLVLGERMDHFEERISLFLKKYQAYSNILVFGHGSWIRALISLSRYGDINRMNKVLVENNDCITVPFQDG